MIVKRSLMICMLAGLFLILMGCDALDSQPVDATPIAEAQLPTPAPTPEINQTTSADAVSEGARFNLRVWLAGPVSIDPSQPGGARLESQLQAFDSQHPDVTLSVEYKTVTGQGGILSYLRNGRSVAPEVLPDLIVLPSSSLNTAVDESLIYPITGLVELTGLFTAADELGRINGAPYGYPLMLTDFYHLAWRGQPDDTIPARWSELSVRPDTRLAFAAAGDDGAALGLQLYADHGGAMVDGEDCFTFQSIPLTDALTDVQTAFSNGTIDSRSTVLRQTEQSWQLLANQEAEVILVNSNIYLERRNQISNLQWSSIPGARGSTAPVVSGWVWAIATSDISRQSLAAELIQALSSDANSGAWTNATQSLPVRPTIFDSWEQSAYIDFLRSELSIAVARPNTIDPTETNGLSSAIISVTTLTTPPNNAAEQLISSLKPQ